MTDKKSRIQALISAIISYLQAHRAASPGVGMTLDKLEAMRLSEQALIDAPLSVVAMILF